MKNLQKIGIYFGIGIVILILVINKMGLFSGSNSDKGSVTKGIKAIPVEGLIMKPGNLQDKIFTNGSVLSNEEVDLRSETSGRLTEILFEEGRSVKKGDLLAKINDSELQATLKKYAFRETLAKDREFRTRQLLEKNLASQQEYDIALNDLNSVNADIEFTKAQISKTEIRAPFDGIIGLRSVSEGSYITPQNKIASLQSINPVKIDFSVPQKYYNIIREGKQIYIKIPGTDKRFNGRIYAVEPKIEQNTRTLQVRALADNSRRELSPGAYVEVEIILNEMNDALLIPSEALVPDLEGEKVYVYKNGLAIPSLVATGIRTEKDIQILSGISRGDTVITSGIVQLRPKTPVSLKEVR
ncbi:MAG: efflux RND transporter periplasmic adaptor subunit [Melioribacteraceae bacterium]|nr:efflux RND transporter periplasmic adaptor subunit [Melioribacteraceae bacterium]